MSLNNPPSIQHYGEAVNSIINSILNGRAMNRSQLEAFQSFIIYYNQIVDSIINGNFNQHEPIQPTPTAASFLESLRVIRVTRSMLESYSNNGCAICTDSFAVNDKLIRLPCQHAYHKDCIVEWLNKSNTCPLCRDKLPEENSTELRRRRVRLIRRRNLDLERNSSGEDSVRRGFAQTEISSPVAEWLSVRRIIRRRTSSL